MADRHLHNLVDGADALVHDLFVDALVLDGEFVLLDGLRTHLELWLLEHALVLLHSLDHHRDAPGHELDNLDHLGLVLVLNLGQGLFDVAVNNLEARVALDLAELVHGLDNDHFKVKVRVLHVLVHWLWHHSVEFISVGRGRRWGRLLHLLVLSENYGLFLFASGLLVVPLGLRVARVAVAQLNNSALRIQKLRIHVLLIWVRRDAAHLQFIFFLKL